MVDVEIVRDGPARMYPASVTCPPLVIEIAPALEFCAAELTVDPDCCVNVPPPLNVMSPPCAGFPSFVFALETIAPASDPLGPWMITPPPPVNAMSPPLPALVRFSAKIALPALRTRLPLTMNCIGQA